MHFEKYTAEANRFMKELAARLGTPEDGDHACRITKPILQTLREILTPEESLHLISQLPMYLKAVYVDGWKFRKADRIRSMDAFLERLTAHAGATYARDFGNKHAAIQKVKIFFEQLQDHITTGEVIDILAQFPTELTELWSPVSKV